MYFVAIIFLSCRVGSEAWPNVGLSLLKFEGKFNSNSNGADSAYISADSKQPEIC